MVLHVVKMFTVLVYGVVQIHCVQPRVMGIERPYLERVPLALPLPLCYTQLFLEACGTMPAFFCNSWDVLILFLWLPFFLSFSEVYQRAAAIFSLQSV